MPKIGARGLIKPILVIISHFTLKGKDSYLFTSVETQSHSGDFISMLSPPDLPNHLIANADITEMNVDDVVRWKTNNVIED
jgi:hypothetical protein